MFEIDYQNILRAKIGLRNGISQAVLRNFCKKHQSDVDTVFQSKNKMGYDFLNLPESSALVRKINKFVSGQRRESWENIVVLGIGGSALGAIAASDALLGPFHHLDPKPHLFVVDNIDPDYVSSLLDKLKLEKTLFVVISKSGGTIEPMALYSLVLDRLKKLSNYQKHLLFITDPKSGLLRKIGKKEKIEMFDIPPKIGGRFSVLTAVGLVPLAMVGVDIGGMLRGAKKMRELIKKSKGLDNPALLLASSLYLLDRKKGKTMAVMMPYSNYLFRTGDWYRQLLAESIGKNKQTGPTPINAMGTTDQHSQLQLFSEGPNNKFLIFLRLKKFKTDLKLGKNLPKELAFLNQKKLSKIIDAAYLGTSQSLAKHGRPNLAISLPSISAETIGALFMLFEFQVALLGLFYKVDAFSQPGVEMSKIITKKILSKTK